MNSAFETSKFKIVETKWSHLSITQNLESIAKNSLSRVRVAFRTICNQKAITFTGFTAVQHPVYEMACFL